MLIMHSYQDAYKLKRDRPPDKSVYPFMPYGISNSRVVGLYIVIYNINHI